MLVVTCAELMVPDHRSRCTATNHSAPTKIPDDFFELFTKKNQFLHLETMRVSVQMARTRKGTRKGKKPTATRL